MATPFEIPQHRYRYPQGDSLPLAPPEKRLRKRLPSAEPTKTEIRPPQPTPDHTWIKRGTGGYWRAKKSTSK